MARNPPVTRRRAAREETADPERVDDVLSALGGRRRRRVLYRLREDDGVGFVDELAAHLSEGSVAGPAELRVELEHLVLPELADAGLVEHERETGLVVYAGDRFDTGLLEWIADRERPAPGRAAPERSDR